MCASILSDASSTGWLGWCSCFIANTKMGSCVYGRTGLEVPKYDRILTQIKVKKASPKPPAPHCSSIGLQFSKLPTASAPLHPSSPFPLVFLMHMSFVCCSLCNFAMQIRYPSSLSLSLSQFLVMGFSRKLRHDNWIEMMEIRAGTDPLLRLANMEWLRWTSMTS